MSGGWVLGLDLSLTSTGVAIVRENGTVASHLVKSTGTKTATVNDTANRLQLIERLVLNLAFNGWEREIIAGCRMAVVEAPSLGSIGGQPHERGGLWWGIAGILAELDIPIAKVAPKTREVYATGLGNGKGKEGKLRVFEAAKLTYAHALVEPFVKDDEADATLMGAMGARHLGFPVERYLPESHLRAMQVVKWPS